MSTLAVPVAEDTSAAPSRLRSRTATAFFIKAWMRLDEKAVGRQVPGTLIIAGLAIALGIAVTVLAYEQDWILLIRDVRSHLTIARAVTDSQNPGFYQLGTVWLPVPHILLIPFTFLFPLWQSGLGGSMLSVACLGVSAAAIWRITYRVGFGRGARLVAVAVFAFNPTLLYFSTTAMTEPVLYAAWLAALAGLANWITARPQMSPGGLATFAGIPTACAVMSRYEGWAFAVVATAFIVLASWRRWRSIRYTVTLVLSFLSATMVALVWWFAYNYVRFGDALEFARGPYSAGSEATTRSNLGMLPTKGNAGLSLSVFHEAAVQIISLPILIAAVVGGCLFIWKRGAATTALLVWVAAFPYPFMLLSLFVGQTIIVNSAALQGGGLYNNRFAAGILPIVALLCGALVDISRRWKPKVGVVVASTLVLFSLAFSYWSFSDAYHRILIIREATNETVEPSAVAAGHWLSDHYTGGSLLLDAGSRGDAMLFDLRNDQIITVDNGPEFAAALADPAANAQWVFINTANPRAVVWKRFQTDPNFLARFSVAYEEGSYRVYKNVNPAEPAS